MWGLATGAAITAAYAMFGGAFAASFSTHEEVVAATRIYLPWAIALPLIGVTSYVFDGIYIGATWTRAMLATMILAFLVYGALILSTGPLGNHGLWLAFSLFLVARALGQAILLPRLIRSTFQEGRTSGPPQ